MGAREFLEHVCGQSIAAPSDAEIRTTSTSVCDSSARPRSRKNSKSGSAPARRSKHELALIEALATSGLPRPVEEHRFDEQHGRKWRFDFAWPDHKVALEVEGGVFSGGRHVRGAGFKADCEKYNAAVMQGWRVLRFVPGTGWINAALWALKEMLQ